MCRRKSSAMQSIEVLCASQNLEAGTLTAKEVFELCSVIDFEGEDNDCRIRHSIELVIREDMSLAVLTCCETVIGDCEYCSAYRELKEEWPSNVASIDLEKLHKRLMSLVAGYEDGQDVFYEP